MTSTIAADSKLMFYPTDLLEVYRIMYLLSGGNVNKHYGSGNTKSFQELLDNKQFEVIDRSFEFCLSCNWNQITVLDPFAGEGVWLSKVKQLHRYSYKVETIAIEIEQDRFDKIEADCKINSAFEDLTLPPQSVSLLLYNPPYGYTNKVRNVRYYLESIIEQDVLLPGGVLVCIIREDDVLGIADLLFANFEGKVHYRVNEEEYAKYKQCVMILTKRETPFDLDILSNMQGLETFKARRQQFIESGLGFEYWSTKLSIPESTKGWEEKFHKFTTRLPRNNTYSEYDKAWDWVCRDSRARLSENFSLVMPKNPKISELANLLASGIINGQVDDPQAPHVVSGGVKNVKRQETTITENAAGDEVEVLKEVRFAQPYLNILTVKNGKIVIKQIESTP